jgi:hypothetical protein
MKKLWTKIKSLFKRATHHPEALPLVGTVVSCYYLGGGIALAFNTLSPIVFLIFAVPALIWFAVLSAQTSKEAANATYS